MVAYSITRTLLSWGKANFSCRARGIIYARYAPTQSWAEFSEREKIAVGKGRLGDDEISQRARKSILPSIVGRLIALIKLR